MSKASLIKKYTGELAKMMSDQDFCRYFGGGVEQKIVKYADLKKYKTINDLLPLDKDYVVILVESAKNSGHWTSVVRNGNKFTQFDPYGDGTIDDELKFIPDSVKRMLGEKPNELKRLFKTKLPGQTVEQNRVALQSKTPNVDTCGRWSIAFILMSQLGYTLPEFQKFIKDQCEATGKPSDIVICDFIK